MTSVSYRLLFASWLLTCSFARLNIDDGVSDRCAVEADDDDLGAGIVRTRVENKLSVAVGDGGVSLNGAYDGYLSYWLAGAIGDGAADRRARLEIGGGGDHSRARCASAVAGAHEGERERCKCRCEP